LLIPVPWKVKIDAPATAAKRQYTAAAASHFPIGFLLSFRISTQLKPVPLLGPGRVPGTRRHTPALALPPRSPDPEVAAIIDKNRSGDGGNAD
jgi:hypothetical protein